MPRRFAATARALPSRAPESPERCSRSNAMSLAEWKRDSGFFSRQCCTMRSSAGETLRLVSLNSGGSSFKIALIVSAAVSPWNARLPDSIS